VTSRSSITATLTRSPRRTFSRAASARGLNIARVLAAGLAQRGVAVVAGLAKGIELAKQVAGNAPMTNFAVTHVLPRIAAADPATAHHRSDRSQESLFLHRLRTLAIVGSFTPRQEVSSKGV